MQGRRGKAPGAGPALGFSTVYWSHSPGPAQACRDTGTGPGAIHAWPLHREGHTGGFAGLDRAAFSLRNGDEPQQHRAATAVPIPSVPYAPGLGHSTVRGCFSCPVPSTVPCVRSSSSSSLLLSYKGCMRIQCFQSPGLIQPQEYTDTSSFCC